MSRNDDQSISKSFVYIPDGAGINEGKFKKEPPKTRYNNRQQNFDREKLKDVTRKGEPNL